jgi:uncharacterized protein DUF6510
MEQRVLDGNAAAGSLGELFVFDVTTAIAICAACGATGEIGEQHTYMDAPGLVIRCIKCESVLIRMVRAPDRWWLDVRGVRCLEVDAPK